MFIAILTYKKPIEQIDAFLEEHILYLKKYHENKKIIFSGRRKPRVGGIILIKSDNIQEVQELVDNDPFSIHDLVNYEIIEFTPTNFDENFKCFID